MSAKNERKTNQLKAHHYLQEYATTHAVGEGVEESQEENYV